MKSYNGYKDSGIEWIGAIPIHWNIKRLKRLAKICGGEDQKEVIDNDGLYPIYGSGGMFGKANKFLHSGPSVLLGRKGTIDKPQYVYSPFWTVDTAFYTDIFPETNPRYFYYLCTTINFEFYKYGSAIPSMSRETLNQIPFACPNLEEQTLLATYLDHKTTQIDKLITDKEKLIELLNEERTVIINQAVTKGLNPNVPMKISGVEWLDDIPQHWQVKKLKYVSTLKSGDTITSDVITQTDLYPVYGGNGLRGNYHQYNLEGDFVLIGRQGALCGNINYATNRFWASEHAIVCHLKGEYNWLWLGNLLTIMKLNQYSQSAAQPGLAVEKIKNLLIPVPPNDEQIKISDLISSENRRINTLRLDILKEIMLLKEYKTALISEVVTGKVDVRNEIISQSLATA